MIKAVCEVFAPSGKEDKIRKFIKNELKDTGVEITIDNIGNLIIGSCAAKRCIECGLDSCGIMIVLEKDGKAYFSGVGGINAQYLIDKKILFENGSFGIVRYDGKNLEECKISDLYMEVEKDSVKVGNFGVVEPNFCENNEKIFANGLGNRIGVALVLEAIKRAGDLSDTCVIFSAQKRFNSKGIQAFFGANEFDEVITVDKVGCKNGINLGDGCILVVADKSGVCDKSLKEKLLGFTSDDIRVKLAVTDENLSIGRILGLGKGTKCAAVGIAVSNNDKTLESVNKSDCDEAVKFLTEVIKPR